MANKASNFSSAISLRSYLNDKISNAETGYTGDILKCLNYPIDNGGTLVPTEVKVYDVELIWVGDQFFVGGAFDINDTMTKKMVPFNNYEWGIDENIAISYTITYDLADGTLAEANPQVYTIESDPITLIIPTKSGYTFAGWTGTGLDAATVTVTIAKGSTGNRAYTATWTAVEQ